MGYRELRLWGSERDLLLDKEMFSTRLKNFLYNRKELNSFKMSEKNMRKFVKDWNKFKPVWVEAYVQSMSEFAKFIQRNNFKMYSPKGILTSAGTLYPEIKQKIEEVFKTKVFNRYGSREVGDMACDDNTNQGLKLSFWNNYLEVLENNKIYITNLNNYSMPFIRYEIGDIGIRGENWSYLEKVEGREISIFTTKEGKIIPAEYFIHFIGVIYNQGYIKKFQVIQKNYNKILIKVVLERKTLFEENRNRIEKSIKKVMGQSCKIDWEFVKNINCLKNGKYLYTINEI